MESFIHKMPPSSLSNLSAVGLLGNRLNYKRRRGASLNRKIKSAWQSNAGARGRSNNHQIIQDDSSKMINLQQELNQANIKQGLLSNETIQSASGANVRQLQKTQAILNHRRIKSANQTGVRPTRRNLIFHQQMSNALFLTEANKKDGVESGEATVGVKSPTNQLLATLQTTSQNKYNFIKGASSGHNSKKTINNSIRVI